jgi:transcription termination factor NusB
MVKFIKIDTRHENIGKIHATGLQQPEGFIGGRQFSAPKSASSPSHQSLATIIERHHGTKKIIKSTTSDFVFFSRLDKTNNALLRLVF